MYNYRSTNTDGVEGTQANQTEHKWRLILEPALVGSMMAINLGQTSLQNFYLRTACTVDLGYSFNICDKGVGEEFRAAEVKILYFLRKLLVLLL